MDRIKFIMSNIHLLKIFVVEDNEPLSRFLCSILEKRTDVQVVGQASDGLEAIQNAEELQPDLILLDIGLPKLNGMQVARRLGKLVPNSKFLFLSQESSADVVREALKLGAVGFIHKSRIYTDLALGLESVIGGTQFVSSTLKGWESTENTDAQVPQRHQITFCSDQTVLLQSLTSFIATALRTGNPAVVIATKSHLDDLSHALKA